MKTGPPPKPTNLRILEGNPANRPLPKNEPIAPAPVRVKAAPRSMGMDGKRRWKELAAGLVKARILSDLDWDALHAYCEAYDSFMKAVRYLKGDRHRKGRLHEFNASGSMIKSPYVTMRNESLDIMRKWANELGITPAARTRVEAIPGEGGNSEDEFFGYSAGSA